MQIISFIRSKKISDEQLFMLSVLESNRFLDLDPNSIASISVLKGLSATVLYGSEGGNGVILITTKNTTSTNTTKKTRLTQ